MNNLEKNYSTIRRTNKATKTTVATTIGSKDLNGDLIGEEVSSTNNWRMNPIREKKMRNNTGMAGGGWKGIETLQTPITPRIELSRASSSSHQEEEEEEEEVEVENKVDADNAISQSRESSPEKLLEQVGTGILQETINLQDTIGFGEDGTMELRSSTEELFFMDAAQPKSEEHRKLRQQQQQRKLVKSSSPVITKYDEQQQAYLQQHQRKDSASSEVAALLGITGRTSRLSSVGSQGSGVSHLSAMSGALRSPSPHRMLLETSFCGPKPVDDAADGKAAVVMVEAPTEKLLEKVLLARTQDPRQAALVEGMAASSSPKRKPPPTSLTDGDQKLKGEIMAQIRPAAAATAVSDECKLGVEGEKRSQKSPGQMIVGKTPSGREYIRINLKPDHMYADKGIAPNEKVVQAPNTIAPIYSRDGSSHGKTEKLITPTASPKLGRSSRSPSPAMQTASRKSSFSSLFRFGARDTPDSPRERSQTRAKSRDRQATPSQTATPSKQKSVLNIFKPGRRGSSSTSQADGQKGIKSPSPSKDAYELQSTHKATAPFITPTGSRPNSRLRYYDEPVEGCIHIPLHTPPEQKELRDIVKSIQQLNNESIRPMGAPITVNDLALAAAALKPVKTRNEVQTIVASIPATTTTTTTTTTQAKTVTRLERKSVEQSATSGYTLAQTTRAVTQDKGKMSHVSAGVDVNHRSGSQDSQDTVASADSAASTIKNSSQILNTQLDEVKEISEQGENKEADLEIFRLPSVESTTSMAEVKLVQTKATINTSIQPEDTVTKERRKLLFTTQLGSGSDEQVFTTQFSISKTDSLSSHVSEQGIESLSENIPMAELQRHDTVLHKDFDNVISEMKMKASKMTGAKSENQEVLTHRSSDESTSKAIRKKSSISTNEDEKHKVSPNTCTTGRIQSSLDEKQKPKSRSTSEDDNDTMGLGKNHRHSRYFENFDIQKTYQESSQNFPLKTKGDASYGLKTPLDSMKSDEVSQESNESNKPPLKQISTKSERKSRTRTPPSPSTVATTELIRAGQSKSFRTFPSSQTVESDFKTQDAESSAAMLKRIQKADRQSLHSTDEPFESSESERDMELANIQQRDSISSTIDAKKRHMTLNVGYMEEHESTGLVSQESFDDELPYIPTTLPEERAQGVSLIPMKDRVNMEVKTCPVERPRSTTPLNPSHLEEYYGILNTSEPTSSITTAEMATTPIVRGEKLRISLPRKDPKKDATTTPRTTTSGSKAWSEFAEEGLRGTHLDRRDSSLQQPAHQQKAAKSEVKPRTPTAIQSHKFGKSANIVNKSTPHRTTPSAQRKLSGHWIDFENIPEKRKPPKRITTLPRDINSVCTNVGKTFAKTSTGIVQHKSSISPTRKQQQSPRKTVGESNNCILKSLGDDRLHYNFVNPEDCQCECHEVTRETSTTSSTTSTGDKKEEPATTHTLQQGDDMLPLIEQENPEALDPSDSSREYSSYTDEEVHLSRTCGRTNHSKTSSTGTRARSSVSSSLSASAIRQSESTFRTSKRKQYTSDP